jgi:hypothetical protein
VVDYTDLAMMGSTVKESPVHARAERVSTNLAWAILVFGIGTALYMAWIVYRTHTPVLFGDQWSFVNVLMRSGGHLNLQLLWAQHNEHRFPFGKLAYFADLKYGAKNVSLLVEIFLIRISEAVFLLWFFRRYYASHRSVFLTAGGFWIFCLFYPIQMENFYWGAGVMDVSLTFAASVAIGAFVIYADRTSARRSAWLITSLAAGMFAECSMASGIFVWPVLLLLAFLCRVDRNIRWLISMIGVLSIAAFVWGLRKPVRTANPWESLRHPLAVAKYMREYLSWSWDPAAPTDRLWPTFSQFCVMLAVAIVLIAFVRMLTSAARPHPLRAFLIANLLFLLVTAFITALGRINFGMVQATDSRYQSFALAFWGSFAALALISLAPSQNQHLRLIAIQTVLLLLLLMSVPRSLEWLSLAKAHQIALSRGYITLVKDPANIEAQTQVATFTNFPELHAFLQSNHLGMDDREIPPAGSINPTDPSQLHSRVKTFQVIDSIHCAGFLDSATPELGWNTRVALTGWAWDMDSHSRPSRVILVSQDGSILGSGRVSIDRPDVRTGVSFVTDLKSGWMAEAYVPHGSVVRAFAVSDPARTACALVNEYGRP